MKEAAITTAKDRSKGELRLQQRRDYARQLEGAGATTDDAGKAATMTTRAEGGKCSRRVVEPRLRVVEEAEGRAEAAFTAAKDRWRRLDARRLSQPLAAGGRGRHCYSDFTVLHINYCYSASNGR